MHKFVLSLAGFAALVLAMPAAAEPVAKTKTGIDLTQSFPNETYSQYYRRGGYYGRPYYGRPYYGRPYGPYYRSYNPGAAVAAGAAGLAAGALIGSAIANQPAAVPAPPGTVSPSVAAYCARRYRSYDPASGTYLSNNGMRYVCTYP